MEFHEFNEHLEDNRGGEISEYLNEDPQLWDFEPIATTIYTIIDNHVEKHYGEALIDVSRAAGESIGKEVARHNQELEEMYGEDDLQDLAEDLSSELTNHIDLNVNGSVQHIFNYLSKNYLESDPEVYGVSHSMLEDEIYESIEKGLELE